ncbi:MAG: EamA family transporter [DPANN group archaeon]|nr:EamA family transporter [DPANN group archaeon]
MNISVVSPLLNFNPAIVAILAFLILGDKLTTIQISGMVILMFGAYLLETKKGNNNFIQTMKKLIALKYIHYLGISFVFYGFSSIIDKFVLGFITPITYIVVIQFFIAINFVIMIYLFHNRMIGIKKGIMRAGKWIFIVAIFTTSYRLLQSQAISMAYISLVIPIKKLSTIFSTIIGGEMFHEKHLLKKTIACVVMLVGVYLIII